MAKYSLSQIADRFLKIKPLLAQGLSIPKACKELGFSAATVRKWMTKYKGLALPVFTEPTLADNYHKEGITFSEDESKIFLVRKSPKGLAFFCFDTSTGERLAENFFAKESSSYTIYGRMPCRVSADGARMIVVDYDGQIVEWEPLKGVASAYKYQLTGQNVRRLDISCGLQYIAYVSEQEAKDGEPERNSICVLDTESGEHTLQQTIEGLDSHNKVMFHGKEQIFGLSGPNKCIWIFDASNGDIILEDGPQAHAFGFCGASGLQILFEDWYGKVCLFDHESGFNEIIAPHWGLRTSMSDRFLADTKEGVLVFDIASQKVETSIDYVGLENVTLSPKGRFVAAFEEHFLLWNLEQLDVV